MLTLKAFGALDVCKGDGASLSAVLSQSKRAALFTYLVLSHPGDFHRRDTLLALFWPELDQEHGRNALSQALTFLRRELGCGVLVARGAEEVGVRAEAVASDVQTFEEALAAGDWTVALDVYRGELLEGLHVSLAPAFVEWVERERRRLRQAAGRAAWRRAHELIGEGRLTEAEGVAEQALVMVPTDESPVCACIAAMSAAGDRGAALRLYDRFVEVLAMELDVSPAPETVALVAAIRARSGRAPDTGKLTMAGVRRPAEVARGGEATASAAARAQEHYLRGTAALNEWSDEGLDSAIVALESAVAEAPSFASAHAALSRAYTEKADLFDPGRALRRKALVHAEAALRLDPASAAAHLALGNVLWTGENGFPHADALREFQRAVALEPDLGPAHDRLALVYLHVGLLDEAMEEAEISAALDPLDYWACLHVGMALAIQRRDEEAAQRLRTIPPQVVPVLRGPLLAQTMARLGQAREALRLLDRVHDEFPTDPWVVATRALIAAELGDAARAELDLAAAGARLRGRAHDHHAEFSIGATYAALGRRSEAVEWLRRAAYDGWPCYPCYAEDPLLRTLDDQPAFVALVNELRQGWMEHRRRFGIDTKQARRPAGDDRLILRHSGLRASS